MSDQFITSQNSSINLRSKLGDILLCLKHWCVFFSISSAGVFKHYQTIKVSRLKITLSVTICFVSTIRDKNN